MMGHQYAFAKRFLRKSFSFMRSDTNFILAGYLSMVNNLAMEIQQTLTINGHHLAAIYLDAGGKSIVIFCHGYRSSSIGPNRFFVTAARQLGEQGISSLRFDQYGSGNSESDFIESSFNDWVMSTQTIAEEYVAKGYKVALFGQSMGAATVLTAAANLNVEAVVAWVPDPSVEAFKAPSSGIIEEGGQIVRASYWKEAHDAEISQKLHNIGAPAYIVQCSDDEYVSAENHQAIVDNAQPNHLVEMFMGHKHSSWSHKQASLIIDKSVLFLRGYL